MTDFGTDVSALPDLNFSVRNSGFAVLGEALLRRLQTRRGSLFYALNYGRDIREWINETLDSDTLYEMASAIAAECENDDRVLAASATVTLTTPRAAEVAISCDTQLGPFRLVLAVTALTVEVLHANGG